MQQPRKRISEAIELAGLGTALPLEASKRLIANTLEQRELPAFLIHWKQEWSMDPSDEVDWDVGLDTFFPRGQQEGTFRNNIAAPALTEIFVFILIGLMAAERRGGGIRAGLASAIVWAILSGAAAGC